MPRKKRVARPASGNVWGRPDPDAGGDRQYQNRLPFACRGSFSREAREDIAAALFRAGEVLAHGGQVDRTGDVYMAEDQSFEDLRSLYAEKLARVQGMIAEKSDAERPVLEKRLIEIQTQVQHMQPLGLRSSTLSETPSEGGVYSEANIDTREPAGASGRAATCGRA